MNRLATACVISAFFAGPSLAQMVQISPEQRTLIRQYVVRENMKPVVMRERIGMGAAIPEEVELRPVPTAWGPGFQAYRYVYANEGVILVEPSTRRVVQIIDGSNPAGTQTNTDGLKRSGDDK